jgi:signal transduction histidine kinase
MGSARLPGPVRRSYPTKLVVAFGVVTLVIGGVGATLYLQTDARLEAETQTELESAAQIEAKALDEWFEEKRLQTKAVAEAAPLRTGSESVVVQHLWTVVDRDADVEAAYLVDTHNGTVVSSVGNSRIVSASSVLSPAGQRDFTRRAGATNDVAVSEPFRPYPGSAAVILLSAAVPGREGRSLVTVVDLRQLANSQPHQLDHARFQVVDADGTVVMAENGSRILRPSRLAHSPPDGTGFVRTEYAGEPAAVGYATMGGRGWTVTAWMPTRHAFALRSTIREGLGWMLATVVVGLGAIALVLTRNTVRPVRDLARTAKRLQDGDLETAVGTDRVDEFGDLYTAFDEMRRSLRRQIARTEQARRESERLSETLEREAERFADVMAACADGDLDRRLAPESHSQSMRKIAAAFNEMMDDVEQQNEELEAFASIISHDLRNPLTVAYGRAELVQSPETREHVEPLLASLDRMQRIVEDGRTLARETQVEDPEPVDLADRAHHAWAHVENREAALTVETGLTVAADPSLLEQLFENLFRNAVEHGGDGVTVTVSGSDEGFAVADDGPGLPETSEETVFQPGVSDGSGGTGLGLTIVKRIADAHGWNVRGTSGPDGGARFEFDVGPSADATHDPAVETHTDNVDAA